MYIFDLDGTLALIEHRRHFVEGTNKDWDGFFAACVNDEPNLPVIGIFKSLCMRATVQIWSGRSDAVGDETVDWLNKHIGEFYMDGVKIRMREAGDYTPDDELKEQWLLGLDHSTVKAVFDDRDRIVKMWRSHGITCLQVAPGDF